MWLRSTLGGMLPPRGSSVSRPVLPWARCSTAVAAPGVIAPGTAAGMAPQSCITAARTTGTQAGTAATTTGAITRVTATTTPTTTLATTTTTSTSTTTTTATTTTSAEPPST